MLETIRQYAREKVLDCGGGEETRDTHLDYYLQVAKQTALEFYGPKELVWLVWLENE